MVKRTAAAGLAFCMLVASFDAHAHSDTGLLVCVILVPVGALFGLIDGARRAGHRKSPWRSGLSSWAVGIGLATPVLYVTHGGWDPVGIFDSLLMSALCMSIPLAIGFFFGYGIRWLMQNR